MRFPISWLAFQPNSLKRICVYSRDQCSRHYRRLFFNERKLREK